MMGCNVCLEEINFVECEVSIHRRGFISIKIDLVNNIATWKESKQWCNDFTRTISVAREMEFRHFLGRSKLIHALVSQGKTDDGLEDLHTHENCEHFAAGSTPLACDESLSDLYSSADPVKSRWSIGILLQNEHISWNGPLPFPVGWRDFQFGLEKICKSSFRLF